jgi:thioredoxin 1
MITRRTFAAATGALVLALSVPAMAFSAAKFTPTALAAAQKTGKPVLVEVTAPWCPTCKAQKAVLSELAKDAKYKDVMTLSVDFDSQKDDVKALKATSQSTLIVYKGGAEVGRLVGDAKRESIVGLLGKAL